MRVIGLTGGIGSGKSTVSELLEEMGAVVIDADKLGHKVYEPGTPGWREVVEAFGKQVLSPSGEVDRAKLSQVVFNNPEARQRLNEITHPKIRDMVDSQLERCRKHGVDVVVLEAALLLETDWPSIVDEIWVTVASPDTVVKRVASRPMSREQALARIRSQMSNQERIERSDIVIHNDGDLEELRATVASLWQNLHSRLKNSHSG